LHSLVLERIKFDLSKINWLRGVILLHSNLIVVLGQVSIVSHSYQTYFGFPRSYLNLDCGLCDHMITRFTSIGIRARLRNKVISLCYFHFFRVPLIFFSVCVHLLVLYVPCHFSTKKRVIFHLVTISKHIYIYIYERLDWRVNTIDSQSVS
jgi:hypothetical protein